MLKRIKSYLQENKIYFFEKTLNIFNKEILQIEFTINKIFKRHYNFFFIESNDMKEIENIVLHLSENKELFTTYIYLFCKTELKISDDKLTYLSTNASQIINCIYYNDTLNELKYINDVDTPKIIKQLIKYLTA